MAKSLSILKKDALKIFKGALNAVKPANAINNAIIISNSILRIEDKIFNLEKFNNIYLIGFGKAAPSMASAIEKKLGRLISKGLIITKHGHSISLKYTEILEAGHPVPDKSGIAATKKLIYFLKNTSKEDLVITLISGGGSALLVKPAEGISLGEKQKTVDLLLRCGAAVDEINTIRKHISAIKGGRLLEYIYPSTSFSLIISDVIDNDIQTISSGPTIYDITTFKDCINIVYKYNLQTKLPRNVLMHLNNGLKDTVKEAPKLNSRLTQKNSNHIISDIDTAIKGAYSEATRLGYNTLILSSAVKGEAKDAAKVLSSIAKETRKTGNPVKPPACIIAGGETTVTVTGKGKGGRNQEFALAALLEIKYDKNIVILSAGTDGTDGATDAAGAISDYKTYKNALKLGIRPIDYIRDNNSYNFFSKTNGLLITGPTGTNVMDIYMALISSKS